MSEALLYVVSAAGFIGIIFSFLSRQQVKNMKALANETAARLEKEIKKKEHSAAQIKQLQDELDKAKSSLSQNEKKLSQSQARVSEKEHELEQLKQEHQDSLANKDRTLDHINEQNTVLTQQLSEAVREKKLALDEVDRLNKKPAAPKVDVKAIKEESAKATKQLTNARKENKAMKREVEKAREILSKIKPGELKKYKAKAARMEQLYTSMKGLRELAEERNENWDKALRLLASHQLGTIETTSKALPQLVAEALESIGQNLIIDEHSHSDQAEPAQELPVRTESHIELHTETTA